MDLGNERVFNTPTTVLPEHVLFCVFLAFIIFLCYLLVCNSGHNSQGTFQVHVRRLLDEWRCFRQKGRRLLYYVRSCIKYPPKYHVVSALLLINAFQPPKEHTPCTYAKSKWGPEFEQLGYCTAKVQFQRSLWGVHTGLRLGVRYGNEKTFGWRGGGYILSLRKGEATFAKWRNRDVFLLLLKVAYKVTYSCVQIWRKVRPQEGSTLCYSEMICFHLISKAAGRGRAVAPKWPQATQTRRKGEGGKTLFRRKAPSRL